MPKSHYGWTLHSGMLVQNPKIGLFIFKYLDEKSVEIRTAH